MLLVVDPGESTGLVVFRSDGRLFLNKTYQDWDQVLLALAQACRKLHPDVIAESMPVGSGRLWVQRFGQLRETAPGLKVIAPSQWKPWAKGQQPPTTPQWVREVERLDTPHERDAYWLGRYWLWRHASSTIGARRS